MQSPRSETFRNRALDVEYAKLLGSLEVFAGLGRVAVAKLAARLESISLSEGTELFHQGDPGDGPALRSGRVSGSQSLCATGRQPQARLFG